MPTHPPRNRAETSLALAAGGALAIPHFFPQAWFSAWLGVLLLAWSLEGDARPQVRVIRWFLACFVHELLAAHWIVGCARGHLGFDLALSWGVGFGEWGLYAALMTLAALPLLTLRRLPVWASLPLSWILGEALVEATTGFGATELFMGQVGCPPLLRAIGQLGWELSLAASLFACAGLARSLHRRQVAWLVAPLAWGLLLAALPERAVPDEHVLRGVGVVQQADAQAPVEVDPELGLLVWPEGATGMEPRLEEGEQTPHVTLRRFATGGPAHLLGMGARTARGHLNAVAAVDALGGVRWVRGKSALVPLAERDFLGLPSPSGAWSRGTEPPLVSVAGRRPIPLVCYEGFQRHLALEGRVHGGDLLAVVASDAPIAHSRVALRQAEAALILRAVELGVPAVRASLGGSALMVDAAGHVLARGTPGVTAVLTWPGRDNAAVSALALAVDHSGPRGLQETP
ncbi:MAG: hypothetical protein ABIO70_03780 [Pseudomonadota bacterium]